MSLPVIKTLIEAADYSSTVAPYWYQLKPLPKIVFESITNLAALKQVYVDTNPLISSLGFSLALGPIFLVAAEVNKNYSQVDRFWSLLPTVYNLHYALYAYMNGTDATRVAAIAAISTLWSTRLTYNYWRKGGYSIGSEDYRWPIVKEYVGPTVMFLFNITFISFAQSVLLWSITTPTYVILLASRLATMSKNVSSWDIVDTVGAGAMLSFITISFIADNQQWRFQSAKQKYRENGTVTPGYKREDLARGFLTKRLFAYSRHPNFAAEQSIWVSLYTWSVGATGSLYNWSGVGAIAYLILFQASTWLTELLSTNKYPEYKEYQKQTGKFVPTNLTEPTFKKSSARITDGQPLNDKDAEKARQRYDLR